MPVMRKLGKLPAKKDARTLKLSRILNVAKLPALPASFDADTNLKANIPLQMLGNDVYGDCVIVGRANYTLRAEYFEQDKVLRITTNDCLNEYWAEQGGNATTRPDNGLVMLDSLNEWRKSGWKTSGKAYTIHAFAAIDVSKRNELLYSIMLLDGGYIGIEVPASAMEQFDQGQPWDVVEDSPIQGGHCIYIVGWNATGPVCVTWGKKQQMTWAFYEKYTDEAYAIVDNQDDWVADDPIDIAALESYLQQICGTPASAAVSVPPAPVAPSAVAVPLASKAGRTKRGRGRPQ